MTATRALLLALLPLLVSCQSLFEKNQPPTRPTERLQGELEWVEGQLHLHTCQGQRSLLLVDNAGTGLAEDALTLNTELDERPFADIRGTLISQTGAGADGQLELSRVYRVQQEGHGCEDAAFKQLIVHASGNEPFWSLNISNRGMLLQRLGEPPLALPYLEEQMPGGSINFSSEANQQRVELWVTPRRCVNSASGAISHLSAELRINNQILRGCAYYGGARNF